MDKVEALFYKICEYEDERNNTEEELGKELYEMVEEEYEGSILTFIYKEVINRGYEGIGWTIRNLYENYEAYVRAFGEFISEQTELSQN